MTQKHISHLKSNQVDTDGNPIAPQPEDILYGELALNYADGVETLYTKNDNDEIVSFSNSEYVESVSEHSVLITYDELKTLRDAGTLVAGRFYRITDYEFTTVQEDTSSAGHVFDVIVRADSTSVLNENAFATWHEGDTYFADAHLNAWELKYCLDNDTSRFAWAGSTNGRGIIFRLKDEWGNDCPYDFKNCLYTLDSEDYYTFDCYTDSTHSDHSLNGAYCYGNVMGEYVSSKKRTLNANVFKNTSKAEYCYANTFGVGCYSNTFSGGCHSNTFGVGCYSNTFGVGFIYHTFGNSCHSNTFGNYCDSNTFGNSCHANTFGSFCSSNTFGNHCDSNTFGNSCSSNTFGENVRGTKTAINYVKNCRIDNGVFYINLTCEDTTESGKNYLQNVQIVKGVSGTSSTPLKVVIPDRNLSYETKVARNSSGDLKIYCEADLIN